MWSRSADHDGHQRLGHHVAPHGALQLDGPEDAPDEALLLDAVHLPRQQQQQQQMFNPWSSQTDAAALQGCKTPTRSVGVRMPWQRSQCGAIRGCVHQREPMSCLRYNSAGFPFLAHPGIPFKHV